MRRGGQGAYMGPKVGYEVLATTDNRVIAVVRALQQVFLNGGVILQSFRPTGQLHVDPSYRSDLRGLDHMLMCLLQVDSVRQSLAELQIPFPLVKLPRYAWYSGFEFEGAVTRILLCGGPFAKCNHTEGICKR